MEDAGSPGSGREVRAIQVAIATSVIGVGVKFTVGFITGSMSMITSAVDSLGDLFISLVNLLVVKYSDRAPDDDHNYGHTKVEGLGAMFEGGFIFAAGGFIVYESVHKLTVRQYSHDSVLGIVVMIPLLALTSATVVYLRKVAKETGSLVIKSDALHYLTDVWVNVGVLVSLTLVKITGHPEIDSIISIGIALYMIYSSLHIVREGFGIVMDESLPAETVTKLREMLAARKDIESFHDFKTRKGKVPHVDFHAVVRPEMTVREEHAVFLDIQKAARAIAGDDTRVLMHSDPRE